MTTEAEIGAMHPPARKCRGSLATTRAARGLGQLLPGTFTLISDVRPPEREHTVPVVLSH